MDLLGHLAFVGLIISETVMRYANLVQILHMVYHSPYAPDRYLNFDHGTGFESIRKKYEIIE